MFDTSAQPEPGDRTIVEPVGGNGGNGGGHRRGVEDQLIEASHQRVVVDLSDGSELWELPASVLVRLCNERVSEIGRFGLRVARAHITGSVDLRAVDVPFGLEFQTCEFDEAMVVEGANLHELAIVTRDIRDDRPSHEVGHLPGLLANGVTIRRDLDLSGTHLDGAFRTAASTSKTATVWLTEADIGGRLLCVGTVIKSRADRALQADRTHFGGNIRMIHGFETDGEVRLIAVRMDGSLDLTGAILTPTNGRAVDLGEAHIGGSLFVIDDEEAHGKTKPEIRGRIEMGHARIEGRVLIRNASLIAPSPGRGGHHYLSTGPVHRCVVSAPRLSVGGDLLLTGSCSVEGGIDLQMAEIQGDVRIDRQALHNPGDRSLDLTTASVGGTVSARHLESRGTISLVGARIQGSVRLAGACLSDPADGGGDGTGTAEPPPAACALDAGRSAVVLGAGANIAGDIELCGTSTEGGELMFRAASVGGNIDAHKAVLKNHGHDALVLDYATVDGDIRLAGEFEADGTVSMVGVATKGIIDLTDATITNDEAEPAVVAVNARADGAMFLRWRRVDPWVNFDGATTPALWDNPDHWPARISIVGFQYGRFWKEAALSQWDTNKRIAWLARQEPLDAAPYEHLAGVLRLRGQPQRAEMVQVAYMRRARLALNRRRRLASAAWDGLTLYGFQPWRVAIIMGLLIVSLAGLLLVPTPRDTMRATGASGTIYAPDGAVSDDSVQAPCGAGDVRCFRPVLYAIDVVVPLVDLGQRQTWRAEPHASWGTLVETTVAIYTLLGWTLSTIFALSFTRLARSR